MTRRILLTASGTWLLQAGASQIPSAEEPPVARLGIVTDVHYAEKPTVGTREYRASLSKLTEAVDLWRSQGVDAAIELGDLVDASPTVEREMADLRRVLEVFKPLKVPRYCVLGNHCVDTLTKPQFLEAWGAKESWYSFALNGYRGIVLDSAFSSDGQPYGGRDFDWRGAYVPPDQLDWLRAELARDSQPAIVFIHHRLDTEDHYSASNAAAVRTALEASGKVLAVFQGHQHVNDHRQIGGIHYCALRSMVDGAPPESSAYGVLNLYSGGRIYLHGYRLMTSRNLPG